MPEIGRLDKLVMSDRDGMKRPLDFPLPEGKKATSALQYKKVAIHMVLHSTFPALRTYLMGIEELPFLVMVDSLQVERIWETTPFLKVTMGLSVYVIT